MARKLIKNCFFLLIILLLSVLVLFQNKYDASFLLLGQYYKPDNVSPAMHHIYKGEISEKVHTLSYSVSYSTNWTSQWLKKREQTLKSAHHKNLLLFCHMRGGSSFFGEFFRANGEVMYWYEPINALYMALYGQKKWQMPFDLFFLRGSGGDFTLRTPLPAWEVSAIAEYNHHLLGCDFNQLPVELFEHPPLHALKCIQQRRNVFANKTDYCDLKVLRKQVSSVCSRNIAKAITNNCANHIKQAHILKIKAGSFQNKSLIPSSFLHYSNCRKYQMKNIIADCLPSLANKCSQSKLVVYIKPTG